MNLTEYQRETLEWVARGYVPFPSHVNEFTFRLLACGDLTDMGLLRHVVYQDQTGAHSRWVVTDAGWNLLTLD
jgi:hypothetical protein